jgi:hypothetical protein
MRRDRKILVGLAVVIALVALYFSLFNHPQKLTLAAYRRQLAAQGEKLAIREIAPRVTAAEQDAAQDLIHSIGLFGPGLADYPPAMRNVVPGRAMIAWAEEAVPTTDSTNVWPTISRRILDHQQELANLRAALQNPRIRLDLDYNLGFSLPLPHLAQLKNAATWLSIATLVELHESHASNAMEKLQACLTLVRPLEKEPLIISQLVRLAIAQMALNATWELLQHPGWQDAQLAGLQAQWSSPNFFDAAAPALEMDRAMRLSACALARTSYSNFQTIQLSGGRPPATVGLGQLLAHPSQNTQHFVAGVAGYSQYYMWKGDWSYQEELYNLQTTEAALNAARLTLTNGAFLSAFKKLAADLTKINSSFANSTNHFCFTFPALAVQSYLLKLADWETERRMLVTAIALKRFQLRSGRYPADLKELVPDYLPELPVDFMDGQILRYRPIGGETYLLYSVGEDGEDNGGDPTPSPNPANLYNAWWKARDIVWPMPANPEQTKAYKEKIVRDWKSKPGNSN